MLVLAYIILLLSLINLLRMVFFLVSSDIYDIKKAKNGQAKEGEYFLRKYAPLITVLVPAHNEEKTLKRNLESIASTFYPRIELIIINDSSKDATPRIARNFQRNFRPRFTRIKVLNANFHGKAKALNRGLKFAKGSLVMCLDADSYLTPNALNEAVATFREKKAGVLSANVKILPRGGVLNLIQQVEYLVCYQMKKAETYHGIQYIVGGIGSMYRRNLIKRLGFYDIDTITEDIDLSMKFIAKYAGRKKISYNPKMIVYTEAALSVSDLLRQRFRWKYGRYQVFLKRAQLFWNTKLSRSVLLSWIYLPYALFAELAYALEPLAILFLFYLIFRYGDFSMLIGSFITFIFYSIVQITGAIESYDRREKLKLVTWAPLIYFWIYILSFVEYVATIRGLLNLGKIWRERQLGLTHCGWTHINRIESQS